jgi:hypothetical protein
MGNYTQQDMVYEVARKLAQRHGFDPDEGVIPANRNQVTNPVYCGDMSIVPVVVREQGPGGPQTWRAWQLYWEISISLVNAGCLIDPQDKYFEFYFDAIDFVVNLGMVMDKYFHFVVNIRKIEPDDVLKAAQKYAEEKLSAGWKEAAQTGAVTPPSPTETRH